MRIDKEKIGGNIRTASEDDAPDGNIKEGDIDFKHLCAGDECKLPDWAAEEQ